MIGIGRYKSKIVIVCVYRYVHNICRVYMQNWLGIFHGHRNVI